VGEGQGGGPEPSESRFRTLIALAVATLATGCVPARIVESEGKQVTFAWNARDTRISRVYSLAIDWCHRWKGPPELVADQVEGDMHRTTFVCRAREGLPANRVF
jgi:hypothetical protein